MDHGRSWSGIEHPSDHRTLGWVFREYITCTDHSIDVPQITETDLQKRASHLSVKEADNQCHSSDRVTRLVGCTAV